MGWDFLYDSVFGIDVMSIIVSALFLLLALLLRKNLTKWVSKLIFLIFKKYIDEQYIHTFEQRVLSSLRGLITIGLIYIAISQFATHLNDINLYSRGIGEARTIVTLLFLIDKVFALLWIIYLTQLVNQSVGFIFLVLMDNMRRKNEVERLQVLPLVRDMLRVLVWVFGTLTILGTVFGVNVGALIAGMGIGGIAIAFALKDSVENLLASILVIIDKPFQIGDWIIVNGVEGNVERIGFRSTRIRTFDKTIVIIPNRKLIEGNLENFTLRKLRRQKLSVAANYGLPIKDYERAIEAIKDAIDNVQGTNGGSSVTIDSFTDAGVMIAITYYVDIDSDVSFATVKEAVNKKIYEAMYQYVRGFSSSSQLPAFGQDINEVFKVD